MNWDQLLAKGVYFDMSFADYRNAPGLNFSALKKMKQSPGACWAEINRDEYTPGSQAQTFGTAGHCAVLEPERWTQEYVTAPEGMRMDKRTKVYKEWLAETVAELGDNITVLSRAEYDRIEAIADSLTTHQDWLFRGIKTEVSIFWEETVNGVVVPCKARPDAVFDGGFWDLKTCRSVQPHAFERDAMKWDYPAQLAFYRRGLKKVHMMEDAGDSYLVAAESTGTEEAVFDMALAMDYGEDLIDAWLEEYAQCCESGLWPRLVENDPHLFRLPRWAEPSDDDGAEGEGVQW